MANVFNEDPAKQILMDFAMSNWLHREIDLRKTDPSIRGGLCEVWQLFLAGMEKSDLRKLLDQCENENSRSFIMDLRKSAGDLFTAMNITTAKATYLLVNIGEQAYNQGIIEPWTVYAHNKLNQRIKWPTIILIIIVLWIISHFF